MSLAKPTQPTMIHLLRRATHHVRAALRDTRPSLGAALNADRLRVHAHLIGNLVRIVVQGMHDTAWSIDATDTQFIVVQVITSTHVFAMLVWMPAPNEEEISFSLVKHTAEGSMTVGPMQLASDGLIADLVADLDRVWRADDDSQTIMEIQQ